MRSVRHGKYLFVPTPLFLDEWTRLGGTSTILVNLSKFIAETGPENLKRISASLRVIRAPLPGRGKRGGARVVVFAEARGFVFFVTCYDRRKQSGLSRAEKLLFDRECESIRKSMGG